MPSTATMMLRSMMGSFVLAVEGDCGPKLPHRRGLMDWGQRTVLHEVPVGRTAGPNALEDLVLLVLRELVEDLCEPVDQADEVPIPSVEMAAVDVGGGLEIVVL